MMIAVMHVHVGVVAFQLEEVQEVDVDEGWGAGVDCYEPHDAVFQGGTAFKERQGVDYEETAQVEYCLVEQ